MSDLQCPAVIVFVPREALEACGGVLDLGDTRLAGVFVATAPIAVAIDGSGWVVLPGT